MYRNDEKGMVYKHLSLKGTSYEIGRKGAELIKNKCPEEIDFLLNGNEITKPFSLKTAKEAIKLFDSYCPNINEEIKGMADFFGRSPEEIIYYSFTYVSKGNCSHFAVLPHNTSDGKTYAGRSYEWSDEDDKRLMTVEADGLYGHLGFSLLFFGRYDGINEKGLCVTMSNGIPCVMPEAEGLRFWMVIRILLDRCKNVEEAVGLIKELPISSYCILIITDRNNESVMVEVNNSVKSFKRISQNSKDGYLCSTNHYTLPEMLKFTRNRMKHSLDRYDAINRTLNGSQVDSMILKKLLSTHMPGGMASHYYDYGLGTLWSILFDVNNIKADICFGSPVVNGWHTFDLNSPEGIYEYRAFLPREEAPPETWMNL